MFVRAMMVYMNIPLFGPTLLGIENEAMFKACRKEGTTAWTRYFERSTTFVKEMALRRFIDLRLVSTDDEVADIFTKAVAIDVHKKMIAHIYRTIEEVKEATMHKETRRSV